jgi:hypothetical protein
MRLLNGKGLEKQVFRLSQVDPEGVKKRIEKGVAKRGKMRRMRASPTG